MNNLILMTGTGSYLPKNKVSNNELSKFVDTSDEWIQQRSGIKFRHFVSESEQTSDLATEAAKMALKDSELTSKDIDLIIVGTTTPDNTFPATAAKVQKNLNSNAISFDIQAVCAGFVYALSVGVSMLRDGYGKKCLIIGADSMSRILDWKDRSTSVLFGDGAGAVVLEKFQIKENNSLNWGVLSNVIYTDGQHYDLLFTDGGVSLNKSTGHIRMHGKEVFKHAVEKLSSSFVEALKKSSYKIDDVDWLIPHQANQRIINAVADKVGFNKDKIVSTVSKHGNTSAASIPIALDYALKKNMIKNGELLGFQAIGGGLSWGSSIIKFGKPKNLLNICL